jgi:hypothetical protein
MKPQTFDTLTRALADPISRRGALGRIVGMLGLSTLGGGTLAALSPGIALAGGGNSDCAHFCNAVFDPGPDRGQCKSDAAHGTGLCPACGNGTLPVCCPTNPDGTCTSYSSAICCSSGQVCQVTPLPGGDFEVACMSPCPSGTVQLSNGTCAMPCPVGGRCCSSGNCFPDNGSAYCTNRQGSFDICTTDSDCPMGEFCNATGINPGHCVTAEVC